MSTKPSRLTASAASAASLSRASLTAIRRGDRCRVLPWVGGSWPVLPRECPLAPHGRGAMRHSTGDMAEVTTFESYTYPAEIHVQHGPRNPPPRARRARSAPALPAMAGTQIRSPLAPTPSPRPGAPASRPRRHCCRRGERPGDRGGSRAGQAKPAGRAARTFLFRAQLNLSAASLASRRQRDPERRERFRGSLPPRP